MFFDIDIKIDLFIIIFTRSSVSGKVIWSRLTTPPHRSELDEKITS